MVRLYLIYSILVCCLRVAHRSLNTSYEYFICIVCAVYPPVLALIMRAHMFVYGFCAKEFYSLVEYNAPARFVRKH